jgi:hypothetical protein
MFSYGKFKIAARAVLIAGKIKITKTPSSCIGNSIQKTIMKEIIILLPS